MFVGIVFDAANNHFEESTFFVVQEQSLGNVSYYKKVMIDELDPAKGLKKILANKKMANGFVTSLQTCFFDGCLSKVFFG